MKRSTLIAVGILAYIFLRDRALNLANKFSATVSNFRLGSVQLSQDRIGFSINVTVQNTSNIPVNLDGISVDIRDENSGIVIGNAQAAGFSIPSQGSGTVPVNGHITLSAASGAIYNLLVGGVPAGQFEMPSALIRVQVEGRWIGPFVYPITLPEW